MIFIASTFFAIDSVFFMIIGLLIIANFVLFPENLTSTVTSTLSECNISFLSLSTFSFLHSLFYLCSANLIILEICACVLEKFKMLLQFQFVFSVHFLVNLTSLSYRINSNHFVWHLSCFLLNYTEEKIFENVSISQNYMKSELI